MRDRLASIRLRFLPGQVSMVWSPGIEREEIQGMKEYVGNDNFSDGGRGGAGRGGGGSDGRW